MSTQFHYSLLTSVVLHGTLLGLSACTFQAAQVDVVRDAYAPVELHLMTEPSVEHQAPLVPPTSGEAVELDITAAERPPSEASRKTSDFLSGRGALMHARPLTAQNQPPRYPWLARLRGWEGTVVIGARIAANGRVAATWIVRSSSHAILDATAQEAIRGWVFKPASQMCAFVASEATIPVRFRLANIQEQERLP